MIEVRDLCKTFRVYNRRSDRFKEWLTMGKVRLHTDTWVLKHINLHVGKGEVFGIVGLNGAGKSTLLKILTGTMAPTSGTIFTEGKIAALLELGTGFHPDLTGRENVLLNGKIMGLETSQLTERLAAIEAFAEIGDYFDKPMRTYSTGMYVRLAFALASAIQPEILIIDEALSVGDAYFQQKCLRKIKGFRDSGTTILFVSHDLGAVKLLCDRVALLDAGEFTAVGTPLEILELYNALLAKKTDGKEYLIEPSGPQAGLKSGNRRAIITRVTLRGKGEQKAFAVEAGEEATFEVDVHFRDDLDQPTVGILIQDRMGYDVFGTNTLHMMKDTGLPKKGERVRYRFQCALNLGPGEYTLTAAVHSGPTHVGENYEWVDRILSFKVLPRSDFQSLGVALLHPKLTIEPIAPAFREGPSKVALVIPWFGKALTGGAEQQAYQIASRLLKEGIDVDVLTTCSRSFHDSWDNAYYQEGCHDEDGLTVHRFPLGRRQLHPFNRVVGKMLAIPQQHLSSQSAPVSREEEEIYWRENIHSPSLVNYIAEQRDNYRAFIFLPYLFPVTRFGVEAAGAKAILQPCLHDECYAYLDGTKKMFEQCGRIFFNSEGEAVLAQNLYGEGIRTKSLVIGEGVEIDMGDLDLAKESPLATPYILYLGKRCPEKKTDFLVEAFTEFAKAHPGKLKLVLAGQGDMPSAKNCADIEDWGVVTGEQKQRLLAHCHALVNPSVNESFSRVVFEAWFAGRPVAVNKSCLATYHAVAAADNAGWAASTIEEWVQIFRDIAATESSQLSEMGRKGQAYARKIADWEQVMQRYKEVLTSSHEGRLGAEAPRSPA